MYKNFYTLGLIMDELKFKQIDKRIVLSLYASLNEVSTFKLISNLICGGRNKNKHGWLKLEDLKMEGVYSNCVRDAIKDSTQDPNALPDDKLERYFEKMEKVVKHQVKERMSHSPCSTKKPATYDTQQQSTEETITV